eukprot:14983185-Ditylum_brightwellii.AAC.1
MVVSRRREYSDYQAQSIQVNSRYADPNQLYRRDLGLITRHSSRQKNWIDGGRSNGGTAKERVL